jgi:tRNA A-37 threonylcarbamoyl transferase component Bud32
VDVNLLGGRFVLVREIGAGGMSTVFLGCDEVLDRPVAVKILRPELEGSDVSARFRREGRTAARLSHPNVVQVYDAGEDVLGGREASYIVVEYVPGGDLKALIDTRGPLPGAILARIGAAVADGLAHAHERGIIHRDIKPQNVLMDEYGSPKLTDFGIARALDSAHSTSTDSYLGTATYSSPEQLQGEKVTPKSDVYSLGATLYHAATGGPPFTGGPLDVASQQLAKPPASPRARGAYIGERLEDLILACLAKEAAERPDAAALHERLLQISAASAPVEAAPSVTGLARATDAARSVGAAGVKAVRRGFGRRGTPQLSGPPEVTISFPTRTFRAGSSQRRALASAIVGLLLVALTAAGAWAVLGDRLGGDMTGPIERISEPQRETPESPPSLRSEDGRGVLAENTPTQEPTEEPALPPEAAEQAVFDMYYEMSFARPETSFAFLSERLQREVGSTAQWAEQEDIYSFTYMEFTEYPNATASGETAEVAFAVRLDRTYGSELLSGTWVCVVEDGEWRLDRLENEQSVQA